MHQNILQEMMPAFEGVLPAVVATASADGIPNVTYISQLHYVNDQHVALSRQFFNKTARNVTENPFLQIIIICPVSYNVYKILLRFIESQASGELFEKMKLQLEIIAGVQGMTEVFNLLSADVYEIIEIERIYP